MTRTKAAPSHGLGPDGLLIVDKPAGITSHDVVYQVRRMLGGKVGHTGTLDPAATGVLPLVLGRATRLAQFLTADEKEYLAWIRLGMRTDTFDLEGRVLEESAPPVLAPETAERILGRFRGPIRQLPPMFSAIKVHGERLYRAARRGEEVERAEREVTVAGLDLLKQDRERWWLRVVCSAGTYIRTLANDLGEALGCGAVLESLQRTRVGAYAIDAAVPLADVMSRWEVALIPIDRLLPEWAEVAVGAECAVRVIHGNPFPAPEEVSAGRVRVTFRGQLLAVARVSCGQVQPEIVVARVGEMPAP